MSNYLEFFGLASEPFESAGSRALVLETGPLRRAVAWARGELAAGQSLLSVLGVRGVGKSRLASALPHVLDQRVGLIPDPTVPWQEIEAAAVGQLGISELNREALQWVPGSAATPPVIVVDQAEALSKQSFERLEALQVPLDEEVGSLLALIFLADERDATPQLRKAQSTFTLAPLQPRELRRYLEARMMNAGRTGEDVFSPAACQAIFDATRGIPSGVDLLCTTLLIEAARAGTSVIEPELVAASCSDGDAPTLKRPESIDADESYPAKKAQGSQSSDTDLPQGFEPAASESRDRELPAERSAPTAAPGEDPQLPVERSELAEADDTLQASAPEAVAAGEGDGDPGDVNEVELLGEDSDPGEYLESAPDLSHLEATPVEVIPYTEAPLGAHSMSWITCAPWAAASLAAVTVTTLIVGVATLVRTGDETASSIPLTSGEAQIELPSRRAPGSDRVLAEEAQPADRIPDSEVVETVQETEPSELVAIANPVAEPSEAEAAPESEDLADTGAAEAGRDDALTKVAATAPPSAPKPVLDAPLLTASQPEVVRVAPRTERTVSSPQKTARRSAPAAAPPARSAQTAVQKIAWPKSFLDAQQRSAKNRGARSRLEIPEPELAGPSRGTH